MSQACFLLRIQRSAKQGQEMGAIPHNTISNSFNDNILSYLPAIFFFFFFKLFGIVNLFFFPSSSLFIFVADLLGAQLSAI